MPAIKNTLANVLGRWSRQRPCNREDASQRAADVSLSYSGSNPGAASEQFLIANGACVDINRGIFFS